MVSYRAIIIGVLLVALQISVGYLVWQWREEMARSSEKLERINTRLESMDHDVTNHLYYKDTIIERLEGLIKKSNTQFLEAVQAQNYRPDLDHLNTSLTMVLKNTQDCEVQLRVLQDKYKDLASRFGEVQDRLKKEHDRAEDMTRLYEKCRDQELIQTEKILNVLNIITQGYFDPRIFLTALFFIMVLVLVKVAAVEIITISKFLWKIIKALSLYFGAMVTVIANVVVSLYRRYFRRGIIVEDREFLVEEAIIVGNPLLNTKNYPASQAVILAKQDDKFVVVGQAFAVNVSENARSQKVPVLVTATHVITSVGKILYIANPSKLRIPVREVRAEQFEELRNDVSYVRLCDIDQWSQLQIQTADFAKVDIPTTVTVTANDRRSTGLLREHPNSFGMVLYQGSTIAGFSGSPYSIGKKAYGMHTGSMQKVGYGLDGMWINCMIVEDLRERDYLPVLESSEDFIINDIIATARSKNVKYKTFSLDDKKYVRYGGRYYDLSNASGNIPKDFWQYTQDASHVSNYENENYEDVEPEDSFLGPRNPVGVESGISRRQGVARKKKSFYPTVPTTESSQVPTRKNMVPLQSIPAQRDVVLPYMLQQPSVASALASVQEVKKSLHHLNELAEF